MQARAATVSIGCQLLPGGGVEDGFLQVSAAAPFLLAAFARGPFRCSRQPLSPVPATGTGSAGRGAAGVSGVRAESNYAGFQRRGIPLVHQVAVAGPVPRRGVATVLMDGAEQLARDRGIAALGITVGLFDEYGPAQRL